MACDVFNWFFFRSNVHAGLRAGGGIGDNLVHPSERDSHYAGRVVFDLLFFVSLGVCACVLFLYNSFLNLILVSCRL